MDRARVSNRAGGVPPSPPDLGGRCPALSAPPCGSHFRAVKREADPPALLQGRRVSSRAFGVRVAA